ncbi:nuclease-related domain-containing protein [Actinotalea sp. K2]|uniref:nuclease-related domain-containing protein n=1 Tax=Actinotalea sp. K2 TaxID=2939438 RepID=UPI002017DF19|nr:nuclease-related domain-containing protein [Actinotalea sp. K2]MCL3862937.1 NERD domain-containing protein [Actinotalea sp. K2]
MEAGHGAEEQASRRARKIARLQQDEAAGLATGDEVRRQIDQAQRQQRAWSAGAEGERLVAITLGTLGQYGWVGLHDVHWPDRPLANIDHIAVGPGGVVIVDAKNWSGDVIVRDGLLRQNGYRRDEQLNGVAQAAAAVTALLLPEHRSAVSGVLCLAAQEDLPPTETTSGVVVVGRHRLASLLVGRSARLSPYEVADISRHLGGLLDSGAGSAASAGRRAQPHRRAAVGVRQPPVGRGPMAKPRRPARSSGRERRRKSAERELVPGLLRIGVVAVLLLAFSSYLQNLG